MPGISGRTIPVLIILLLFFSCNEKDNNFQNISTVTVKDSMNREIKIPATVSRIIGSGAGALRYITYMQCQDKVIAVDDMEKERPRFDARPYAFANPQLRDLPLFGEFRGNDNPELISVLVGKPVFKEMDESFNKKA